jgi:hypothetical protein
MIFLPQEGIMKKYKTAEPKKLITDYELLIAIQRFTPVKRKALLFAIASKLSPEIIELLDWVSIKRYPLNKKAVCILNALPRHL